MLMLTSSQIQRYCDDTFYAWTRGNLFVATSNIGSGQQTSRTITYQPYSNGQGEGIQENCPSISVFSWLYQCLWMFLRPRIKWQWATGSSKWISSMVRSQWLLLFSISISLIDLTLHHRSAKAVLPVQSSRGYAALQPRSAVCRSRCSTLIESVPRPATCEITQSLNERENLHI